MKLSVPLLLPTLADTVWRLFETAIRATINDGYAKRVATPLVHLVQDKLRRIRRQFAALVKRAIAGTLPPPRKPRPRPAPAAMERPEGWEPKPRPASPWPRKFGWGAWLVGGGCISGAIHMEHLVNTDAEMAALLAAAPQAGRILRPLFWMMGTPLPPALRLARAKLAPPEGYVPGNERYRRRNPLLGFSATEMLIRCGWRSPGHYPKRKPRPRKPSAAAEARRLWAEDLALAEARLKLGGPLFQRPPPRSRKLGI